LRVQVLLQTYIEYLRGKIEETKEMNHHGKAVVVNTAAKIIPVEYDPISSNILGLKNGSLERFRFALLMNKFNKML
jgi:hypothetical protein